MSNINKELLAEGINLEKFIPCKSPIYIDRETGEEKTVKLSASQKILNLVVRHKMVGFVDINNNAYLYLIREGIIAPLQSEQTIDYFLNAYLADERINCNTKILTEVLATIEAVCKNQKIKHDVFRRVGMKNDKIYLDLCNQENEVVEIDAEGYRIITSSPVIFLRHNDIAALPRPMEAVDKEQVMELQEFLNCKNENNFRLVICYLVHLFFPENYDGAKVILALEGEAGTAKSSFTRIVKSLVDPSNNPLLSTPKSINDLKIYAKSQWVLTLDNLSDVSQSLSDALCGLSTGTGALSRKLFTDDNFLSYKLKGCLIINGISEYMHREDLLDRCIVFNLPVIEGNKRRSENELWGDFNSKRCEIFSAFLNILSGTLKMLPEVTLAANFSRMADFAKIGRAVELYMGWEPETFERVYKNNQHTMADNSLHQNVISNSLLHYLKKRYCSLNDGFDLKIRTQDLFKALKRLNHSEDFANPEFPNDVSVFSRKLMQLAPNFRKVGIIISSCKHKEVRAIRISANAGGVVNL